MGCHSVKKSHKQMTMKLSLISILLFSLASSNPLPSKEQEEQARGLLEDIIIGQIQNQINNLLGITTTRGTPILDLAGGILGGGETTTPAPAQNANLIQILMGLLFPTNSTTITAAPTTTKCGGLFGGGLLC